MKPIVYVIVGATATGKTKLAIDVAKVANGEIISADSMQVYREMDIGTAKPTKSEMSGVPHHMIDICTPDHYYSVAEYQIQATMYLNEIIQRNKTPVIVGGSGLYINSLTYDLDFTATQSDISYRSSLKEKSNDDLYNLLKNMNPQAAERIHPNNRVRVIRALEIVKNGVENNYNFNKPNDCYYFKIIGLNCERSVLYEKINDRVDNMLDLGLEIEVENLYKKYGNTPTAFKGIGYKEFISYFNDEYDYCTAVDKIKQHSRNFAKRQQTWFNRDKRIKWLDINEIDKLKADFILENIVN